MKQTFSFTKNALIWFLLSILLSLLSIFFPRCPHVLKGSFTFPYFHFDPKRNEDEGEEWEGRFSWTTFLPGQSISSLFSLSPLFSSHFLLFSLLTFSFSLLFQKTLRQDFSHPSKVTRVAVVPSTMTVIFQLLVAFPSLCRTVTVFAMHFISWEGEKQEMFSSRCVRGCHVLPSTIRPSSNWIRGITRIASHGKNLMKPDARWEQKELP